MPNCRPDSCAGSSSDSTSAALRPPVVTRANTYSLPLLPPLAGGGEAGGEPEAALRVSAFTMTSDGDTPLRLQKPRRAWRHWICGSEDGRVKKARARKRGMNWGRIAPLNSYHQNTSPKCLRLAQTHTSYWDGPAATPQRFSLRFSLDFPPFSSLPYPLAFPILSFSLNCP